MYNLRMKTEKTSSLSQMSITGISDLALQTFDREKLKDVLDTSRLDDGSGSDSCTAPRSSSRSPIASPGPGPSSSVPDSTSVYPGRLLCNSCRAHREVNNSESLLQKWTVRRKNEPVEARSQRLERERTAKKNKRACETDEEKQMRRLRDREAKCMQRIQELDDQRERRLQREREAVRLKRANETPEKRQARLIREREAKRIKRCLEKIDLI